MVADSVVVAATAEAEAAAQLARRLLQIPCTAKKSRSKHVLSHGRVQIIGPANPKSLTLSIEDHLPVRNT
jgi:hypothetical protein